MRQECARSHRWAYTSAACGLLTLSTPSLCWRVCVYEICSHVHCLESSKGAASVHLCKTAAAPLPHIDAIAWLQQHETSSCAGCF